MTQTVSDYVASCPVCQRVKADHPGPRGLFHALPLPSRRGGMWGIDFIGPLQASAEGFNLLQVHIDHLSGKVVSLPTRDTATAAEAAKIFLDVCLRNGSGVPDVVVLDHDPKFRGAFFTAFAKGLGSALIVGSAYHKTRGSRWSGPLPSQGAGPPDGSRDRWHLSATARTPCRRPTPLSTPTHPPLQH